MNSGEALVSKSITATALLSLSLALAACGNTKEERGITGAGLGAAGGAILGAVTGLSVLEGALIGTGVGGVTGLLTDKDDIDIGDPIWKSWFGGDRQGQSSGSAGSSAGSGGATSVAQTQRDLKALGYDPGPVDGVMGPKTRAALQAYRLDRASSSELAGDLPK